MLVLWGLSDRRRHVRLLSVGLMCKILNVIRAE